MSISFISGPFASAKASEKGPMKKNCGCASTCSVTMAARAGESSTTRIKQQHGAADESQTKGPK